MIKKSNYAQEECGVKKTLTKFMDQMTLINIMNWTGKTRYAILNIDSIDPARGDL